MSKIAFHVLKDFYKPQMDPVYRILKKDHDCILTNDLSKIIKFKPKILVVADSRYYLYRHRLPSTIIIWVRHGFSSKNHLRESINGCDYACVSSDWLVKEYERKGMNPRLGYLKTGLISMDSVLDQKKTSVPELPEQFIRNRYRILYAPTWNRYMSSVNMFSGDWIEYLLDKVEDTGIIIKPHPYIFDLYPGIVEKWRIAAGRHQDRILFVEGGDKNVCDYFSLTDILISDASTVIFYYLALNRPIILIKNPDHKLDKTYYDQEGPEWKWRDCGIEVEALDELVKSVKFSIENTESNHDKRIEYRDKIYGKILDGRSAERLAGSIRSLSSPIEQQEEWVKEAWGKMKLWEEKNRSGEFSNNMFRLFAKSGDLFNRFPRIKHKLQYFRKLLFPKI